MTSTNDSVYYNCYFKLVYTCKTINYTINSNITISEFIDYVKNRIREDFQLNIYEDIEIIQSGQFPNVNGNQAEMAPALQPSDYRLCDLYNINSFDIKTFYIRKISV